MSNKREEFYNDGENRQKVKIQIYLHCQLNTNWQENHKPSNDRSYRPKQQHNLINRNSIGRCKAAQGLLTALVLFFHPLFNTTIRKSNGLFISHY